MNSNCSQSITGRGINQMLRFTYEILEENIEIQNIISFDGSLSVSLGVASRSQRTKPYVAYVKLSDPGVNMNEHS